MEEKKDLQWFEKLRLNSWEVEILIVGFVLVILFNIPDTLSLELTKIQVGFSVKGEEDLLIWFVRLITLGIISKIVQILIISFSLYLGLRGFWVGVLGLSSVYPDGINIKKLNFNKIFNKQISQYNFNDFIIRIDNICSSIFSLSFLISFSIVSLCVFLIELMVLAVYLEKFTFNLLDDSSVLYLIIFCPFFICGLIYFIDYFLFGILKKIKWRPIGYLLNIIDKFYKYVTLVFIYDTLYYAFISNVKRRVVFLLLVCCIFIFSAYESVELEKQIYFPNVKSSKFIMKSKNYADKFQQRDHYDDNLYPNYPFIQSDVISENHLKLHIPYHSILNRPIEIFCPEVSEIFLVADTSEEQKIEKQERILNCINHAYSLFIDSEEVESDFIFYDYAHILLDIKSFFMLIPLEQFTNGRHILRIDKLLKDDLTGASFIDGKFGQEFTSSSDSTLYIPFYISR
jgi:hypothetical protein